VKDFYRQLSCVICSQLYWKKAIWKACGVRWKAGKRGQSCIKNTVFFKADSNKNMYFLKNARLEVLTMHEGAPYNEKT